MKIGDLQIDLVSDGWVSVDAGGPFGLVPRSLYQKYLSPDGDNRVPLALTSLLIRSQRKTILVETGIGDKLSTSDQEGWRLSRVNGGLVDNLADLGVGHEEVDIVINTHLHSDHCGGNTQVKDAEYVPTFPNAEYWVQRMEWADASHPDARTRGTYHAENFAPLMKEDRLKLLHGDTQVTDHVRCVVTPGHTRGHQSVVLQEGDWQGFFPADMATLAVHFARTSWLTSYDVYPLENLKSNRRWQKWAIESQAWIFFVHETQLPVARLIERDGKRDLESFVDAQSLIDALPTPLPHHV
jgi:glyoxylase-like metal-dependent hydrolase (beta-lactamase superfamily II)